MELSRRRAYQFFPVKCPVTLTFVTTTRTCRITGYVESNEADIFKQVPTLQISVICPDPWFYSAGDDAGSTEITFAGIEPYFEAEYYPDGNYYWPGPDDDMIEFGQINTDRSGIVNYAGDGEIGMTITLRAIGAVRNPIVYRSDTNESISLQLDMFAGDAVQICTVRGKKSILLQRGGTTTNILRTRTKSSTWIQLTHGDNLISFSADSGEDNLQIQIGHDTIYEGI